MIKEELLAGALKTAHLKKTVLVITGPTGVGKTELVMQIAAQLPVEIVSADSRQIYRLMDIGTAKPTPEMLQAVPHHFIDILAPDGHYSAGEYGRKARKTVLDILQRARFPLIIGGSGLYLRALLEGFFSETVKDAQLRKNLLQRLEMDGHEALYRELAQVDPATAEKNHPHNTRRVIRALEVFYKTGTPLSIIQRENPDPAPFRWVKIAITRERKRLYIRINKRVEEMFEAGLVSEVRDILEQGYDPALNALNSVGYKEVIAHLNQETDLFTCKELIKQNTRRYAKRQLTWLRGEMDLQWIQSGSGRASGDVLEDVLETYNAS